MLTRLRQQRSALRNHTIGIDAERRKSDRIALGLASGRAQIQAPLPPAGPDDCANCARLRSDLEASNGELKRLRELTAAMRSEHDRVVESHQRILAERDAASRRSSDAADERCAEFTTQLEKARGDLVFVQADRDDNQAFSSASLTCRHPHTERK